MNSLKFILVSSVVLLVFAGQVSAAPTYGFVGVSNDSPINTAVGENQLSVELFDLGSQVKFVFSNTGPSASSITDIYWGGTTGILTKKNIINGSGVSYSWGASPPAMQGGADWTTSVAADSDSPVAAKGVNPGESVGFTFNVLSGSTFSSIVSGIDAKTINIGVHVQAFSNCGSEWFQVGNNPPMVPAPAALILASVGTGLVGLLKRRTSL